LARVDIHVKKRKECPRVALPLYSWSTRSSCSSCRCRCMDRRIGSNVGRDPVVDTTLTVRTWDPGLSCSATPHLTLAMEPMHPVAQPPTTRGATEDPEPEIVPFHMLREHPQHREDLEAREEHVGEHRHGNADRSDAGPYCGRRNGVDRGSRAERRRRRRRWRLRGTFEKEGQMREERGDAEVQREVE
jgi:hypothetical protein